MAINMRFRQNLSIIVTLILADLFSIFGVSLIGTIDILWIVLVIPILGSLILSLCLDAEKFDFDEWLIYCFGIGLTTLLFMGLTLNTIGLQIGQPVLRSAIITPLFNAIILGLLLARNTLFLNQSSEKLFPQFFSQYSITLILRAFLPLCLPILAAFGAIRLNNEAGNGLALVALAGVCLYPLGLIVFTKKIYQEEILTSLFAIAAALLLSVSMRSNYLIGFDIHQEFKVFSTAVSAGIWQPHLFHDAYNSCLSITILPATLKALLPISSGYIFKLIMQLLFAVMPIIVFVIANRRLKQQRYAYIAALLFIVQGAFIFQFPGLIRQEIGLIFFGLIFASAASNILSKTAKSVFLIFFGMAMVTSHYSTTYVTIALLLLMLIFKPLLNWAKKKFKKTPYVKKQTQQSSWYISPVIVLIIILTSFLWYGETLQASGGVLQKITNSITSFSSVFNSDSHSDFVTNTIGFQKYTYTSETLDQLAKKNSINGGFRPTPEQYQPQPASSNGPNIDSSPKEIIFTVEHKIIPLFAGMMVAIGLLVMFLKALSDNNNLDDGLIAVSAVCLFLFLAVLPNLSNDYNLERLYQQLLVIIAPAFIYGFLTVFTRWLKPRTLMASMTIVVICYLLGTAGLLDELIFGVSNINLVNDGTNYDRYYITDNEIASFMWLQSVSGPVRINLDRYSLLNAQAYTTIPANELHEGLFPTEITPKAFVYASRSNVHKGLAFDLDKTHIITYSFPVQYISSTKSIVYSNRNSVIYR